MAYPPSPATSCASVPSINVAAVGDGCTSEETCNTLGVTDTNQRVLLHRARTKVRAALEAAFDTMEATRRVLAWIPARGTPVAFTHAIEQAPWQHWPTEWQRETYSSWKSLEALLTRYVDGKRVAITRSNVSPSASGKSPRSPRRNSIAGKRASPSAIASADGSTAT